MKMIFSALTLVLALFTVTTVRAADKKIGNVIAVERTIEDVYQTCIDNLKSSKDMPSFATCKFDVKKSNADFLQGAQRLLTLAKDGCEVEGTAQASVILISFQARSEKATLADSKACLRKAIDGSENGDTFKFIIYTVE